VGFRAKIAQMEERPLITLVKASLRDAAVLAEMNRQMIADEGYRGKLSLPKSKNRIRGWLRSGEYEAVFFLDHEGSRVGYALFQRQRDALFFTKRQVFLRHFFITRSRRRKGVGTRAFKALKEELWKGTNRVDLHVLIRNRRAVDFWHSLGFREYQFGMELEIPGS
jgi:GNAT superfamily N-acetyltransferase